jgi:hypothetical protein
MSQRDETAEKLSQLHDQLEAGDGSITDLLREVGIEAESNLQSFEAIGEALGRVIGGLIGRKLAKTLARELDINDTLLTSPFNQIDVASTLANAGTGNRDDSADVTDSEMKESAAELSDEFDEMTTDELQSIADKLMNELEERSEGE